jgi:hypothetical protein
MKRKILRPTSLIVSTFPASQTLEQAQPALFPDITKNIVDGIFNKIFSNW